MFKFKDRIDAGIVLSEYLNKYNNQPDVMVLALPRGGVPVAYEIAKSIHAPLDVLIVRKLGVPFHVELAFGALTLNNMTFFNESVIQDCQLTKAQIQQVISEEEQELARRLQKYRKGKLPLDLVDKTVILVDDGIATGATIKVAILALQKMHLKRLIVAVPVAQSDVAIEIETMVDEFICPLRPASLVAVGGWYEYFEQTEDEEVYRLLDISI